MSKLDPSPPQAAVAFPLTGPVTVCPPGRRSRNIVSRERPDGGVPITTATALKWPGSARLAPPAANDRRSAQERVEAAEREAALSVAVNQPHRCGADDPRDPKLATALWHFCLKAWPRRLTDKGEDVNEAHRRDMFRAGEDYGIIVHQHRVWLDLGSGGKTRSEGLSAALTDAEIIARAEAARMKREDADAVLRGVGPGALSAMVRVCVDEQPPTPYQEGVLRHCLWAMAVHIGIVKLGRFDKANTL